MLVGGIWTLFSLRKSLASGIKSGLAAARKNMGATVIADIDRDLPMKWMLIALVAFTIPLALLHQAIVSAWLVSIPMTLTMIVAGFLFVRSEERRVGKACDSPCRTRVSPYY